MNQLHFRPFFVDDFEDKSNKLHGEFLASHVEQPTMSCPARTCIDMCDSARVSIPHTFPLGGSMSLKISYVWLVC